MKISLNWLKEYVDIKVPTEDLIQLIGSRLVEVEETVDLSQKYKGIKIVEVKTVEKVAGSDHLSKCIINDGSNEHPVVCGAPNVRAGMLAVWLAPGVVLPESFEDEEPLVLDQRKIMGVESSGMLAGADELGFGTEHKTIAEIDPAMARAGDDFAEVFQLNDTIIDVENKSLTHRPDCFGIIGFAREVAGILGQKFVEPEIFGGAEELQTSRGYIEDGEIDSHSESLESSTVSSSQIIKQYKQLEVKIADPNICPHYSAAVLEHFSEKPSQYLSTTTVLLAKSGMRSVSPIVDITNYLMLLTGQPLHAFDYDKLVAVGGKESPEIIIRVAKKDEKITLLDGKTISCDVNDILVTSNDVPVALAGAMGAANTAIDETTKRIVIESATFNLYNLRRTQMKHGIFSEAITRFTKGQPPALATLVLQECVDFLTTQYEMSLAYDIIDCYPNQTENAPINFSVYELNKLLGTDFTYLDVDKTLQNVSFQVSTDADNGTTVVAPWWRTDIHIKEDIFEEIGRLNGYDNIPSALPSRTFAGIAADQLGDLKTQIRQILASNGANEVLTYSFVNRSLLEKSGQDLQNSYKIINSISPDLEYFRQSLTPSLLNKAYVNIKDGYSDFALFEINQASQKSDGLTSENIPVMKHKVCVVLHNNSKQTAYYSAQILAKELLIRLGVKVKFLPAKNASSITAPFELDMQRAAEIRDEITGVNLGVVGEYKRSIINNMKLPESVAGFEIDLESILQRASTNVKQLKESNYPSVDRDITFRVASDLPYVELEESIRQSLKDQKLKFTILPVSIYQSEEQATKNISFALTFASHEKTLSGDDISMIIDHIIIKAKDSLNAEVV